MKLLLLSLLLNGFVALRANDNLLQNGDFSGGLAHWSGDVRMAGEVDTGEAKLPPGAVIKLKPHEWSRVEQEFELKAGTYTLHVVLTLLPNLHFSTDYSDYKELGHSLQFSDPYNLVDADTGQWAVVVDDPTAGKSLHWTIDPTRPSGQQSYTFTVTDINFDNRQMLIIGFPPGHGLVILQNVTLMPANT
jgi:hypothetical protein